MLNKIFLIYLSFSLVIIIGFIDFQLFKKFGMTQFVIHNLGAFATGAFLIIFSNKLLKNNKKTIYHLTRFVGISMVIIHTIKLLIGNCI